MSKVIGSGTINGHELVRLTGYVRRPDVLTFEVWDDGLVTITTSGKVSAEEAAPIARRLATFVNRAAKASQKEMPPGFEYDAPLVMVSPGEVCDVSAKLPAELCPAAIRRLVVPDDVARSFLIGQLKIGAGVLWRGQALVPATQFNSLLAAEINLVVDAELDVAFSVLCLEEEPRAFTFRVEGTKVGGAT